MFNLSIIFHSQLIHITFFKLVSFTNPLQIPIHFISNHFFISPLLSLVHFKLILQLHFISHNSNWFSIFSFNPNFILLFIPKHNSIHYFGLHPLIFKLDFKFYMNLIYPLFINVEFNSFQSILNLSFLQLVLLTNFILIFSFI